MMAVSVSSGKVGEFCVIIPHLVGQFVGVTYPL
jgi:hypothetical protein